MEVVDRRTDQLAWSSLRCAAMRIRSRTGSGVVERQLERNVEETIVFYSLVDNIDAQIYVVKFSRNLFQLSDDVVGVSDTSRSVTSQRNVLLGIRTFALYGYI